MIRVREVDEQVAQMLQNTFRLLTYCQGTNKKHKNNLRLIAYACIYG